MSAGDTITISIQGVVTKTATLATSLNRLSARERTEILDVCLHRTMAWFLAAYGPLRFTNYARSELGYRESASTVSAKSRHVKEYADADLPNVWNGETREAYKAARFESVATGGRTSGQIRGKIVVTLPEYLKYQKTDLTRKTVRKISVVEGGRIADRFFKELVSANSRMTWSTQTREGQIAPRASMSVADAPDNRATVTMQRESAALGVRSG